jgi:hypothetical protein
VPNAKAVKPFLLVVCIVVFHSLPLRAQLFVGPEAGLNFSWAALADNDLKNDYHVRPSPGYNAGLRVAFQVRKRFYLHVSALYSTKGKTVKGITDSELFNRVRYNYVDLPVAYTVDFKGHVGKRGYLYKYFFGLGPNLSYWLGGKGSLFNVDFAEANLEKATYRIVFDAPVVPLREDAMYVERPTRLQLGLNLVAGIVFEPRPRQRILSTVRYEYGHSYMSRTSNGIFANTYYQDELKSRNQGFRLSIAYLYDSNVAQRKKGKSTINKHRLH